MITNLLPLCTESYTGVTNREPHWIRVWSMNETILERQLSEVPSVIINATGPLGNKKAWAIYIALLQSDEGLRFNQIRDLFEAEPPEIARGLKVLSNAGLIAKQARTLDDVGNTKASFYVPTTLGKALIAALYRGLLPSREDEHEERGEGPLSRSANARKARNRTDASPGKSVAHRSNYRPFVREGRSACPQIRRREYRRPRRPGTPRAAFSS